MYSALKHAALFCKETIFLWKIPVYSLVSNKIIERYIKYTNFNVLIIVSPPVPPQGRHSWMLTMGPPSNYTHFVFICAIPCDLFPYFHPDTLEPPGNFYEKTLIC